LVAMFGLLHRRAPLGGIGSRIRFSPIIWPCTENALRGPFFPANATTPSSEPPTRPPTQSTKVRRNGNSLLTVSRSGVGVTENLAPFFPVRGTGGGRKSANVGPRLRLEGPMDRPESAPLRPESVPSPKIESEVQDGGIARSLRPFAFAGLAPNISAIGVTRST